MARIEGRKADHINITLNENVTPGYRYWDDIRFIHEALPEIDYDDIDTSDMVLDKRLEFPFIVNAITGGFDGATRINENIAKEKVAKKTTRTRRSKKNAPAAEAAAPEAPATEPAAEEAKAE